MVRSRSHLIWFSVTVRWVAEILWKLWALLAYWSRFITTLLFCPTTIYFVSSSSRSQLAKVLTPNFVTKNAKERIVSSSFFPRDIFCILLIFIGLKSYIIFSHNRHAFHSRNQSLSLNHVRNKERVCWRDRQGSTIANVCQGQECYPKRGQETTRAIRTSRGTSGEILDIIWFCDWTNNAKIFHLNENSSATPILWRSGEKAPFTTLLRKRESNEAKLILI